MPMLFSEKDGAGTVKHPVLCDSVLLLAWQYALSAAGQIWRIWNRNQKTVNLWICKLVKGPPKSENASYHSFVSDTILILWLRLRECDRPSSRALPLTWSSPAASEIVHQRDMLVAAVKRVYGYSETDLFHNRATTEGRNLPGKSYRDIKQNWELKRKRMTQGRHSNGKQILAWILIHLKHEFSAKQYVHVVPQSKKLIASLTLKPI